ncbi:hypothetical protein [Goodfellowiella coeruleoviolacea]|uniref:ABC transporter n=1 Tax=Goodfellowiella coeruleoviolacea TaxID=334858 RepID=A0AAE3G8M2_9PSEU|nr:hypothetical protein [Goodfellowiella coeruleoviolacea]MCP2163682.1 hypothetical protein [Goodfellowiella coeruleoviolacea]
MIALVRYALATLLHSQRYLPPTLLFVAGLAVFAGSDNGPLAPVYAICAGALFVCATWVTVALVNVEDPVLRAITVVNAGRSGRVLAATVLAALACCLVLAVVGLGYPLVTGRHPVTPVALLLGAEAQLTAACTGVAVGLVCSRLVIGRPGYSLVAALALVLFLLLARGVPPVNPLVRLLTEERAAEDVVGPVTGYAAAAVVLLLASTALTRFVAARRD